MFTMSRISRKRFNRHRARPGPWLIVVIFVLALLAPLASAAPPGETPSETQPLSTETAQQPCEDGFAPDAQGICQPEPELPPPPCPPGMVYNDQGTCIPDPNLQPTCNDGANLNPQTGDCEAPVEQPAPTATEQDEPAEGETAAPLSEGNGITIVTYDCTGRVTDPSLTEAAFNLACLAPHSGIEFVAGFGGGSVTSTTNELGMVGWTGLPAGPWFVQATVPAGFVNPVVFCGSLPDGDRLPVTVLDGRISGTFATTGEAVHCDWYNIPGVSGGSHWFSLSVHTCPFGTDSARPREELQFTCRPDTDVEYTLTTTSGAAPDITGPDGRAHWPHLPSGIWSLQASGEEGFSAARVFCGEGWPELPAPGGILEGTLDTSEFGETCQWYNFRSAPVDDNNQVSISAFTCADDVDHTLARTDLMLLCTRTPGVTFTYTLDSVSDTQVTSDFGMVVWNNVPSGLWAVQESIPAGYGNPVVYCYPNHATGFVQQAAPGGVIEYDFGTTAATEESYDCLVFNFSGIVIVPGGTGPEPGEIESTDTTEPTESVTGSTVILQKLTCPAGAAPSILLALIDCTSSAEPVDFSLASSSGTVTTSTGDGIATWTNVTPGEITITEHTPPGFRDPVVHCLPGPAGFAEGPGSGLLLLALAPVPVIDGGISFDLPATTDLLCVFINVEQGPATLTIHKWTCPAGYDVDRLGADPTVDCIETTDGIEFILEYPDHSGLISVTGEHGPGTAHFSPLAPGTYVLTESGLEGSGNTAFTWNCTGGGIGAVHPTPLNRGAILTLNIAAGDALTCDWYNVPPPTHGTLVVHKQQCATATFVDPVDCDTFEHGATFELVSLATDTSAGSATTDTTGAASWTGLTAGRYRLTELDATPCHVDISRSGPDGTVQVVAGETTMVTVYNCVAVTTTTTSTGKIPIKYPNTGGGTANEPQAHTSQDNPASTPDPGSGSTPAAFYQIACLHAQETVNNSPVPVSPASDEACMRGAVPTHLLVDDASINADIEIAEIVDGVMQAPTDPFTASWYRETARLGESNNMVMAGHLNWWGVSEGVFFHLTELEPGDRIDVTGNDGHIYVYEVRWVRLEPNDVPPALDIVGSTDVPSLTLITCGGEWNAATAEYDARTVVRAVLVDVALGDAASSDPSSDTFPVTYRVAGLGRLDHMLINTMAALLAPSRTRIRARSWVAIRHPSNVPPLQQSETDPDAP